MRKSPRVSVNLPVTLYNSGQTLKGQAANLGLGGIYVVMESPPPMKAVVNLSLPLAANAPDLEVLVRVVRTEPRGLGAEFLDLDGHSRSLLRAFLTPLWPRQVRACPYCGRRFPQRVRKHCPTCQKSLDRRHYGNLDDAAPEEMIGMCESMRQVFSLIRQVAATEAPVLITGASGAGKKTVARAIHERSPRARGPFVEVNCGAIPPDLLEAELFGCEKGALTEALGAHRGHVERAQGGTLFLEEVGELPGDLQVKLWRFLQESSFLRVGGRQPLKGDCRLIAATNTNLQELMAAGRFREDLHHRLDVAPINLIPLKERGDDAIILAHVFLRRAAAKLGKPVRGFTPEAVAAIRNHPWPGNVKELINRMRRAVVMSEQTLAAPEHLGLDNIQPEPEPVFLGKTLKEARAEFEARLVKEALQHFHGNVHLASLALKVSRSTLYYIIQKYRLKSLAATSSL